LQLSDKHLIDYFLKKTALYFFIFLNALISLSLKSQVSAPKLRCVSVSSPTSAVLSWIIPADPSNLFTQYQIWSSPTQAGVYTMVGTVNAYNQTTFTHAPSNAGLQSQYYYVKTISGANTSVPSDTLRSIYINLSGGNVNGIASLNWNAIKTPILPTSSPTYTVSKESPAGIWTTIYSGNKLNYKDTIFLCKIFNNYKVEISDSYGCVSQSNINGDTCYNIQAPNRLILDSVSVNSAGQSVIGWPPSSALDVNSYIIYHSSGGFLTAIDTIYGYNNTSFTFTAATANSSSQGYCVAALDSCGNYSIPSLQINSMFLSTTYDLCSRTANLTWTAYTDLPKGVLKYDIYCSVSGGTFTKIGSSGSTTFSHVGLNPGVLYCYFIRVRNSDLSISASSNQQCFTASGLPGPTYVYINSVSVNTTNKQVEISFSVDNINPYKGCNIFKSIDGVTFTKIAFTASTTVTPQSYIDTEVRTIEKNYYYKIQVADNCDNPGVVSNVSKTILLHVSNDSKNIFYNTLTWDDYTTWLGGVQSFNIYRAVNGVFDPIPVTNVLIGTRTYVDDVQDFVSDQGKFSYYVEAIEGPGNIHGFKDAAKSNPADAYVEVNVFVPNAFSPKGINNIWLPIAQYVEKTDYKVMVFNRWGDKIFETHSDTEGWTGNAATDEVYVYLIEYKNARGEYIQLKGHVNIIR
jgi:gliding motility-associated-like protein